MNLNFVKAMASNALSALGKSSTTLPFLILLALTVIWYFTNEEGTWPIEAMDADHPVANTLGEVIMSCNRNGQWNPGYQHPGVDILAAHSGCLDSPYAVNIAEGYLTHFTDNSQYGNFDAVYILAKDCKRKYIYTHLDRTTIDQTLKDKDLDLTDDQILTCSIPTNSMLVGVGERLGKIADVFAGDKDHLHLQVEAIGSSIPRPFLNGLAGIWPNPDMNSPTPVEVHLAEHGSNPWVEFPLREPPDACREVGGAVDIVVKVGDRDDAGSQASAAGHVFAHEVTWRLCAAGGTGCTNWNPTHRYDSISNDFADGDDLNKRFSDKPPWVTQPDPWTVSSVPVQCPIVTEAATFMILGKGDGTATWNTTDVNALGGDLYPNGHYELTVKAGGIGDAPTEVTTQVCVENPVN